MDEILYRNDGAAMDENSHTADQDALVQNVSKHVGKLLIRMNFTDITALDAHIDSSLARAVQAHENITHFHFVGTVNHTFSFGSISEYSRFTLVTKKNLISKLENGVNKACGQESNGGSIIQQAPINNDLNVARWQGPDYANYEGSRQHPKAFLPMRFDMGRSFMSTLPSTDVVCAGRTMKRILMEPYAARTLGNGKTEKRQLLPQICWRGDNAESVFSLQLSFYDNLIWNSEVALGGAKDTPTSNDTETIPRGSGSKTSTSDLEFPRMFGSHSFRIIAEGNPELNNHIWEFHDCCMLADADLPIFGGGQFPNLSIHMSEQAKPISVLFGVDTFLERIICSLSRSVVVYHEDGPVEDYDVVFKEEIPHIVGSEFDPVNLKSIIKNTMTFLSKNIAHRGHTYWLLREKKTNHLKLYDLTSTCSSISSLPNWNPFLSPLSTELIEKSARNRPEKISNVIYGLLSAAAKIAENENYAETKICAHYSLAGVYLMFEFDEDNSKLDQYSYLMESLDDVPSNSGYPRITSTIQVDCLAASSSREDIQDDNQDFNASSLDPRNEPSEVRSECARRALEHCLQVAPLSCRDSRILELAAKDVEIEGKFDCSTFWFGGNDCEAKRALWMRRIEAAIERFCLLLREYPTPHHSASFPPTIALITPAVVAYRVAVTAMSLAGILLLISRGELGTVNGSEDDDENPDTQIQRAIDLVQKARSLYRVSLDVLDLSNGDEREYEVSIRISTVTALKLQYTINVKIHNMAATDKVNCDLVDEVCELYTKIFSLLDEGCVPENDGSIYVNTLYEFGSALFIFSDHLKDETSLEWQDKRIYYLEAAIRALQGAYKRKEIKCQRGNACKKLCEAYYVLLALKSRKINTRPELSSLRAQKAAFKELAEIALTAQNYVIDMSDEDLGSEFKEVPLNLSEAAILMVPMRQSIKRLHKDSALYANVTMVPAADKEYPKLRVRRIKSNGALWEDFGAGPVLVEDYEFVLLSFQEWRNNPSMKSAYSHVLFVLPNNPEEARDVMMKSIEKALRAFDKTR
ncbi:unnamed protein product [Angiostrongylus costaricensis]|uniref:Protein kinase domain-containing protein n=1 Tax=Angiostrongylus costaricensis TaxID=334426 RepID=A0A158PJS9_ANGCS|nr:unnamed protein product [Angiostrongylus costaricensis]